MTRFDVSVSVWNTFWFRELVAGFAGGGLKVDSLGTSREMIGAARHRQLRLAAFLIMRRIRTSREIYRKASIELFDWQVSHSMSDASVLWALGGTSLYTIRRAKKKGMSVVLDVGGAHKRMQWELLAAEYERMGEDFPESLFAWWTSKCEQEYELADWITVPSSFVKNSLIQYGVSQSKIVLNPFGVDYDRWNSISKIESPAPQDRKIVFIYTANLSIRKGVQYLLEAWKMADTANAELILVGGGHPDFFQQRYPEVPNVRYLGMCSHAQIAEIYKTASVYVLPSLLEGMARSGIEALTAGLPSIITPETGLTDVIIDGKSGWVVPSRNVEALAERLTWCANHPEEVAAASLAASQTPKLLSFERYGAQAARMLRAILDGRPPESYDFSPFQAGG